MPHSARPPFSRPARLGGFTLMEMMMSVVILGVLMAFAVPGFQSMVRSSQLTSSANEMLTAFQLARSEALRRGQRVVLCRSSNPEATSPSCATATTGAWAGWIMFVDTDSDRVLDTNEALLRVHDNDPVFQMSVSSNISGNANAIVFRPDGLARASNGALLSARVRLCVPETIPATNIRDLAITVGGRTRVIRSAGAGLCAAPANS